MTRTEKWRYRRVLLETEKQILQTMLLNTSEDLMRIHSDMSNGLLTRSEALDRQMGNPIEQLESWFK